MDRFGSRQLPKQYSLTFSRAKFFSVSLSHPCRIISKQSGTSAATIIGDTALNALPCPAINTAFSWSSKLRQVLSLTLTSPISNSFPFLLVRGAWGDLGRGPAWCMTLGPWVGALAITLGPSTSTYSNHNFSVRNRRFTHLSRQRI